MIHIICLTKTYNEEDFKYWMRYYSSMNCNIIILDNNSNVDIKTISEAFKCTYFKIDGWPNQWEMFGSILNKYNKIEDFKDGDFIAFLDDDEYLWFNPEEYLNLEEALVDNFKQLDSLLLPEILMSTKFLKDKRNEILPLFSTFRRNDYSSQGKSIIRYNSASKYSYTKKPIEIGHVPWVDGIRMSDVVGSGVSKTTYGICDYNAPIRLYHYHIKSKEDWKIKINRGSAATKVINRINGTYDDDITKNKKYGQYDVNDLTMYSIFRKMKNV